MALRSCYRVNGDADGETLHALHDRRTLRGYSDVGVGESSRRNSLLYALCADVSSCSVPQYGGEMRY
jgi:hypothetical protein